LTHAQGLSAALQKEVDASIEALADWKARAVKAEQQHKALQAELQQRTAGAQGQLNEALAQLQERTQRIRELERAVEAAAAARAQAEKEASARVAAQELKTQEALLRLANQSKERKEWEGQMRAEMEALSKQQRQEWERREATKVREMQGLLLTVQEKSKEVRRLELELEKQHVPRPVPASRPPLSRAAPQPPPPPAAALMPLAESKDDSTDRTLIEPLTPASADEDWAKSLIEEFDK
jgi:hypothetical protein